MLCSTILLAAAPVCAQDNASADAQGVVLDGFQLQNVDSLEFDTIVPTGMGGSVTLDADTGAVSTIGQVVAVGTNQTRARFTAKASLGTILILSGDPSVTLKRAGGTETMTASLIHKGGAGLATTMVFGLPIGLLATAPDQEIFTGGTLNVAGNQMEGIYEGNFTLLVSYL